MDGRKSRSNLACMTPRRAWRLSVVICAAGLTSIAAAQAPPVSFAPLVESVHKGVVNVEVESRAQPGDNSDEGEGPQDFFDRFFGGQQQLPGVPNRPQVKK